MNEGLWNISQCLEKNCDFYSCDLGEMQAKQQLRCNKHLRSCHLTSSFILSSCVPWPLLRVVWILFMPGISDWDCRICFGLQVQHLVTWYVLSWKITLTSSIGGWKQGGTGVQVEATPCHPSGDMSRRFDIHFNIPRNAYHTIEIMMAGSRPDTNHWIVRANSKQPWLKC